MARRYRYEHLQRKKAREEMKALRAKEKEEKLNARSDKEKEIREAISWIIYIILVVCATYFIVTYVGQRTKVSGDSMQPSLYNNDNLIIKPLRQKKVRVHLYERVDYGVSSALMS